MLKLMQLQSFQGLERHRPTRSMTSFNSPSMQVPMAFNSYGNPLSRMIFMARPTYLLMLTPL